MEEEINKDIIIAVLKKHKKDFEAKYGLIELGIFGSFAKGEENGFSDIDILIELKKDKKNIHNFFKLKRELEYLLGREVDLGLISSLKPIVAESIKEEIIYV